MDSIIAWIVVLFFAIFEMVGGAFTGVGVRSLLAAVRAGGDPGAQAADYQRARTTLVSGCTFGFAAILFSAFTVRTINPWYFVVGVVIYVAVTAGAAFLPEGTPAEIGAGTFAAIGLGLAATMLGILVGLMAFEKGETLFGIIWAGIAGLVGLTFLSSGIKALLSGGAEDLSPNASGDLEIKTRLNGDQTAAKRRTRQRQ